MSKLSRRNWNSPCQATQPEERRKHTRRNCLIAVDCATPERASTEFATNISAGGVYIETRMPVRQHELLTFIFTIPETHTVIKVIGKMARRSGLGLGVKFPGQEQQLQRIVENLSNC